MKKVYILISLTTLIIASFLFYWFELRPAEIMHDCSWVEVHENEKPANPGITKEEADKEKQECLDECKQDNRKICFCKFIDYSPKPPTPAEESKDWWRKATDKEYKFCLHNKGLK